MSSGCSRTCRCAPGPGFSVDGSRIYLLGDTREELDGSEWAHVVHGHLGGMPPVVDLAHEMRLSALLQQGVAAGWFTTAHDLSEGGLAQALAEAVLRHGLGARIDLSALQESSGLDAFTALFSESTGRVLVAVAPGRDEEFLAAVGDLPGVELGVVDDESVDGLLVAARGADGSEAGFGVDLATLDVTHTQTLPALLGR